MHRSVTPPLRDESSSGDVVVVVTVTADDEDDDDGAVMVVAGDNDFDFEAMALVDSSGSSCVPEGPISKLRPVSP